MKEFIHIEKEYSQNVSSYISFKEDFDKNNLIKHFFEHCDSFNANDPKFPRMSIREYARRATELANSKAGLSTSDNIIIGFEIAPRQGEKNTKNRLVKIKRQWDFVDPNIKGTEDIGEVVIYSKDGYIVSYYASKPNRIKTLLSQFVKELDENTSKEEIKETMKKLNEEKENVIKEIDWNGHHYTFINHFYNTGSKSHDVLTMKDENGNSWTGETTWINRPWHRFDLEEAFDEIVSKAFGPKALEMVEKIDKDSYSVEEVIEKFFAQLKPEDISNSNETKIDDSEEGRRNALAKYLKVNNDEIREEGNNEFAYDDATYKVLTDEEAEEEFDTKVRNLWDDLGLESIGDYLKDWVYENAIDEDALEDFVRNDVVDYYDNMSNDEIVDEAIDNDLIAPEEAYEEDEGEDGYPVLKSSLGIDNLKSQLVDLKMDDIDNYVEYLRDMGYDDEFFKDYLDEEAVIEAIKDDIDVNGSRAQEIAYYDGDEIDLGDGLFAYRVD